MYNNTNTDVKVPVQKYHLNLEIMETCTFMTYVVQFGFLFYVCRVASYWMINLFTKEKRLLTLKNACCAVKIQKGVSITFPSTPFQHPIIGNLIVSKSVYHTS